MLEIGKSLSPAVGFLYPVLLPMMPSRASLFLYVAFAVLLLALAVLAWWLFSGRKGGRADGAEGLASQFRVTRVQEADGALWVVSTRRDGSRSSAA